MRAEEHASLRRLRLAALASDPDAFGSTHAREAGRPAAWWTAWASASEAGATQRTFVVDGDDGWLGLALVRRDDEAPHAAVLNAMWVAPEARGHGAARSLCDACAAWAAARGCTELRLDVKADNNGARRAYEAAGFAVREERAGDELRMVRALARG